MITDSKSKPILLTGAHRSGTTWLANMLTLSGEMQIASEPFNLDAWAYKLNGLAKYWFTYAPSLDQEEAIAAFQKVINCKTGKVYGRRTIQRYLPFVRKGRVLIKDPIASLSSEWLANNFTLDVIVLVRHPAAFAASLKRMQWYFPFDHLLQQEQLMDDLLYPFRREIEAGYTDIIKQAALIWNIIYHVLSIYVERNPDWIVVKHEVLSLKPVDELHVLYEELGLTWSLDVESGISRYTTKDKRADLKKGVAHQMVRDSKKNISRWKSMLSDNEIAIVRRTTDNIACKYYTDMDW